MKENQRKWSKKEELKKFLSYYRPYRKIFLLDLFFAVVSAGATLLFPLVSGYITGEVLADRSEETVPLLLRAGGVLLLLVLVRAAADVIYGHWGHAMGAKMEGDMREDLLAQYERLSVGFFAKNGVGQLMTVASNDLENMTELFHHAPEDLLMTVIKFVGALVILCSIHWPLALIVFGAFPFLCLISVWADRRFQKALLSSKQLMGELNGQLEDTLSGIRTVKAFGNEKYEAEKFRAVNRSFVKSRCYFYKVEAVFYNVMAAYPQFLTLLVVFFGALLVGSGIDAAVLVTFLLYVGCVSEPIQTGANFMRLYENGRASFRRFLDMMELEPAVPEPEHPVVLTEGKGELQLENVTFRYESGEEPVLEGLSLRIKAGEKLALVGSSGIGKTTLANLLIRFYDPTEGRVLLHGVDLKTLSPVSLRQNIGVVQQEVTIFSGTVRENIAYGRPDASLEEIRRAAALAGAEEFIDRLEQGYDTVVGTKGITLSGGQRQRISLARVFLKNPPVLILDEATSALDGETERAVQQALEKLQEGRTSVIIAHRLSTIRNADRIVVLRGKGIAEEGTHEELLAAGGEYARLYRASGAEEER